MMNAKDNCPAWAKKLQEQARARLMKKCTAIRLNTQHVCDDFMAEFYNGWIKDQPIGHVQIVYFKLSPGNEFFEFYLHAEPNKY